MGIVDSRQKSKTIKQQATATKKKKKGTKFGPRGRKTKLNLDRVESDPSDLGQSWSDQLSSALCDAFGKKDGSKLHNLYADAFPAGYKE